MLKVLTVVGLFAARVPAEVPKLNPQFHVDFNANRAEKTMHTFYQPFPNSFDNTKDIEVMGAWAHTWKAAGWATRMLTLIDAQGHPLFNSVKNRLNKLDEAKALGGNTEYEKMCYYRYLAIAGNGGGWMSDYDTIPLTMMNDNGKYPFPDKFTSFSKHVPALMVGTADQWTSLVLRMLDVVEAAVFKDYSKLSAFETTKMLKRCGETCSNPKSPYSDMIGLLLVGFVQTLHIEAAGSADMYYMTPAAAVDSLSKPYLNYTGVEEGKINRFCEKSRMMKALHMSHSSMRKTFGSTDKARVAKRGEFMRIVYSQYQHFCSKLSNLTKVNLAYNRQNTRRAGGPDFMKLE